MIPNADEFEMVFWNTPNENAQGIALADLAGRYHGTNDKRIAKFLAEIVVGEGYSRDIRISAYVFLFEVVNRALTEIPSLGDFRVPESMDLPFVYQYLEKREQDTR